MVKQIIGTRTKFQNYKLYAYASIDQMLSKEQFDRALKLVANNFNSSYCRNDGGGKFTLHPLPLKAQLSALNGMVAEDFDGDGNLDVVINTNDYGTDVTIGRYDALNGLMLKGDGKGNFTPLPIIESGIFIPGNGKAMVKFRSKGDKYLLGAGQNRGPLKIFELKKNSRQVPLLTGEISAEILFMNGKKQKQEFNYGSSFLSQSARFLLAGNTVKTIIITDYLGKIRTLSF